MPHKQGDTYISDYHPAGCEDTDESKECPDCGYNLCLKCDKHTLKAYKRGDGDLLDDLHDILDAHSLICKCGG